jgi:hypothetical protein
MKHRMAVVEEAVAVQKIVFIYRNDVYIHQEVSGRTSFELLNAEWAS